MPVIEDKITVLLRFHYANLSHVCANLAHRALPIGLRGSRERGNVSIGLDLGAVRDMTMPPIPTFRRTDVFLGMFRLEKTEL